ncbi:MAG: phosphatidylserine decarboxylase family protein [Acidobacteriota bacterium]
MRIVKDAYYFALPGLVLAAGAAWRGWLWVAVVLLFLAGFVLFFFRDPERVPPDDPAAIVSPADGKVIQVRGSEGGTLVSIFLSIFDVHVNRAPVGGTVGRCEHRPGKFLLAFDERASVENEQVVYEIGDVRFALIAGLVARRIVPWKKVGDQVGPGDRIALIRFGSRVDILLPPGAEVLVQPGRRVKAGVSILAKRRERG